MDKPELVWTDQRLVTCAAIRKGKKKLQTTWYSLDQFRMFRLELRKI